MTSVSSGKHPYGIRILLVEDDLAQAELIRMGLVNGYCDVYVRHEPDAHQALGFLESVAEPGTPGRPDFAVVDLRLPGMSGHELLRVIKQDKRLCTLPVVVLSTSASDADRIAAYQSGANSYLVKSLDHLEFREMLHDLVKYWSNWNQSMPVA